MCSDLFLVLQLQNAPEEMIKRSRHVVTEIQRTIDAAVALEKGDFNKFGQLMNESHDSLKNDYEVSSVELDILVSLAREINGVLGSRLTGAGFGGCTVTLLKKDIIDEVIEHIKAKLDFIQFFSITTALIFGNSFHKYYCFFYRYPGNATFYVAKPAMGAKVLEIN